MDSMSPGFSPARPALLIEFGVSMAPFPTSSEPLGIMIPSTI